MIGYQPWSSPIPTLAGLIVDDSAIMLEWESIIINKAKCRR